MPLFGLKKYQNAKCKNANIFGAVKNARSERRENVAHGSNLTAEKWSVLVGIVQTNTGHFVYGEIFVILCVKRKRQERYKPNYQRITKKKGGQEHASDSNRKNYGRGSQRHLRSDRKPMEEQNDSAVMSRLWRVRPTTCTNWRSSPNWSRRRRSFTA